MKGKFFCALLKDCSGESIENKGQGNKRRSRGKLRGYCSHGGDGDGLDHGSSRDVLNRWVDVKCKQRFQKKEIWDSSPTLVPANPNINLHVYAENLFMIDSTVHLSVSGLGLQEQQVQVANVIVQFDLLYTKAQLIEDQLKNVCTSQPQENGLRASLAAHSVPKRKNFPCVSLRIQEKTDDACHVVTLNQMFVLEVRVK